MLLYLRKKRNRIINSVQDIYEGIIILEKYLVCFFRMQTCIMHQDQELTKAAVVYAFEWLTMKESPVQTAGLNIAVVKNSPR